MSMNAIHCCIVFSPSKESALKKLEHIFEYRPVDKKHVRENTVEYISGNEKWVWLNPNRPDVARGYRAHKAIIDVDCTIRQLHLVIEPVCYLYCESCEYYYGDE